jgi:hypothetical protein
MQASLAGDPLDSGANLVRPWGIEVLTAMGTQAGSVLDRFGTAFGSHRACGPGKLVLKDADSPPQAVPGPAIKS